VYYYHNNLKRQRNSRDENKKIKDGEVPEDWVNNSYKLSQKDTDARWMTKNKERHYGYKNSVKVDNESKIVTSFKTTDASVHDSQVLDDLLDKSDKDRSFMPIAHTQVNR
jgi:IS5 family transposase